MGGLHFNESNFVDDAPPGAIAFWPYGEESIPYGWVKCDGQNGTPPLLGKFILGAGGDFDVGDAGGAESGSHQHSVNIVSGGGSQVYKAGIAVAYANESPSHPHNHRFQGNTDPTTVSFMPPYHALLPIMKL